MRKRQLSWIGHALRRKHDEPEVAHGRTKRGKKQATTVIFVVYYFQPTVKLHYQNWLILLVHVNYGRKESPNLVKQRPNKEKEEELCELS